MCVKQKRTQRRFHVDKVGCLFHIRNPDLRIRNGTYFRRYICVTSAKDGRKPTTENRQPTIGNRKPTTENRQPTIGNRRRPPVDEPFAGREPGLDIVLLRDAHAFEVQQHPRQDAVIRRRRRLGAALRRQSEKSWLCTVHEFALLARVASRTYTNLCCRTAAHRSVVLQRMGGIRMPGFRVINANRGGFRVIGKFLGQDERCDHGGLRSNRRVRHEIT